jgi:hypothetical protein
VAYAVGAAPATAMATMQLTENILCFMFASVPGRETVHPVGTRVPTGIWFKPTDFRYAP